MAKYYVQSGTIRTIISAEDQEKAALWTVHQVLQQVIPVYEEDEATPMQKSRSASQAGVMVLGNEISVSELGFDRSDSIHLDTFELMVHWHQLMVALERLSTHLNQV